MTNLTSKVLDDNDYKKLENLAYMNYEKNLQWYNKCLSFEVSSKWRDLKYHSVMLFYYNYNMFYNLSMYAKEMINENYELAYNYLDNSSAWLHKASEELDMINLLLELSNSD